MSSGIILVLDGLDDISYGELDGKTPYDFGKGQNFRFVEGCSESGLLQTIPEEFIPDTMVGMLTILGVGADKIPRGRSYLEAISHGIEFGKRDLILRGNYAMFDELDRLKNPFKVPDSDTVKQVKEYFSHNGMTLHYLDAYRSIIVAKNASDFIQNFISFPPHQHIGNAFQTILSHGNAFADNLSQITKELYRQTRPYAVLPWGESVYEGLPRFSFSAAMVGGTAVVSGISEMMGMENVVYESYTGDIDTNLNSKARIAIELLKNHQLVVVHIGGTDEATHRRNPREKAAFVEKIDKEVIEYFVESLPDSSRLLIMSDHCAYCSVGGHGSEPVKFWLYRKNGLPKNVGLVENIPAYRLVLGEE